ncbi:MAG TPA: flagellar biosynthesis protein FlhA [Bryobacteraceae bacterium]|nr:flagellar biosynthesis protein FlhA [Bryobacteraceae bacterium]
MQNVQAMPAPKVPGASAKILGHIGDLGVPIAVLAIVVALITPVPAFLMDFLIVIDIMLSVIVMMVAMYILRPVDFSVFPTTLLLLTLFRLALNVSSSRLILLNGNGGTAAAGQVIESFGNFVVGGNYIIGAVIFLVLIAIQYVVINHGAVRISEVAARFTLDALPGKQMSIDADLNAGLIDEAEARRRRKQLSTEAEFYGAMDGASRFTQRDAVASILITGINILAGFLIGVLQHGMELKRALQTYTVLTIGDGLVTVVPALMISVSGGLIVTRASSEARVGVEFQKQLFSKPQPLFLASGVLLALAAFPGLPTIPFLLMGSGLGSAAWWKRKKIDAGVKTQAQIAAPAQAKDNIDALLKVETVAIEVGLGLASLAAGGANSPLLARIGGIRKQMASSLGYVLPPVRVTDNVNLRSREYVIQLKGVEVARYELMPASELAVPTARADKTFQGQQTREPAFGLPALWVPSEQAEAARAAGYTVVDAVNVMGTHFSEIVRRYAFEIFSRQDAKAFCDRIAQDHPKVVEDLVPKMLSLAVIQRVLQNLLRERVSIRDGVSVLEALGEAAATTKNVVLLTEYVRQAVRRTIVKPYLNQRGELPAWLLDAGSEQRLESAVEHGEQNSILAMAPQQVREVLQRIEQKIEKPEAPTVLITSSGARHFLRQITEAAMPNLVVLSHNEVPPNVRVLSLGVL